MREFLELLNSRGVDYVIVGAHSFAFHGRPRYTGDLNILIRATVENAVKLVVAYMTAFDGWVHDRFGGVWMLNAEALLALVFVAAGLFALQQINARCAAPSAIRP